MAVVFNPLITSAGKAAAILASNTGFEVEITHIAFGSGTSYDPSGDESALLSEVIRIPVGAGSRINPQQIRMAALWQADTGTFPITEVGIYAGTTLFAIWSSTQQGALATKSPGVDFVFYYDLALTFLPPNSVTVVADSGQSAFLAALGAHMNDQSAHPQYMRVVDYTANQDLIWLGEADGTANALTLDLTAYQEVPILKAGHRFSFKAKFNNTGPATLEIGDLGVKQLRKEGSVLLVEDDLRAGSLYEVIYDGTAFQVVIGLGSNSGVVERYDYTGIGPYPAEYTPGNVQVFLNGDMLKSTDFTATDGETVEIPSAVAGDDVVIYAYRSFFVADSYTKAEADARFVQIGGAIDGDWFDLTDGATISVNASLASNFRVTIAGNRAFQNPDGMSAAQVIRFQIRQDAVGGWVPTFGSKYDFFKGTPTFNTAPNSTDLIIGIYDEVQDKLLCFLAGSGSGGGGGSSTLLGLTDVSDTPPTNGQRLRYNATSGLWESVTPYYDVVFSQFGALGANELLINYKPGIALSLPVNLAGSDATSEVAATASTVLSIRKNGTQVATITFGAGSTTGTLSTQAAVSFTATDKLSVVAPAPADATLASVALRLRFEEV